MALLCFDIYFCDSPTTAVARKKINQTTSHLHISVHLALIRQFPTYNLEAGSCLPVHSGLGQRFFRFVVL